jgi:hypothetical protein
MAIAGSPVFPKRPEGEKKGEEVKRCSSKGVKAKSGKRTIGKYQLLLKRYPFQRRCNLPIVTCHFLLLNIKL